MKNFMRKLYLVPVAGVAGLLASNSAHADFATEVAALVIDTSPIESIGILVLSVLALSFLIMSGLRMFRKNGA